MITQRLGAQLYADGIRHTLDVPYQVFEDQRSGETLGKLQKVRTDVERLIKASIDILFTTLVGIVFVTVYAFSVHWIVAPAYFLCVPALALLSSTLSKKIKTVQSAIVKETAALAGSTTESLRNIELVKSLGLAAAGGAPPQRHHGQDPGPGAAQGPLPAQPQLHPGHGRQRAAHVDPRPDAVPHLHPADHGRPVLLALDLLVLHLRASPADRRRHRDLPGDGGQPRPIPGHPGHPGREAARAPGGRRSAARPRVRFRELHPPDRVRARARAT